MNDREKLDQIINLIAERSRILLDEIGDMDPTKDDYDSILEINSSQISVLDELYNEAIKIKNLE